MRLIILFGIISLLGDMIYEGARSVNGPYLDVLGVSAATVGLVAGAGELLGYGLRLATGYLSDRTRAYWAFTILGYGMLVTVPMMALSGIWQIIAFLIIMERVGKAIRNPAKDTILSQSVKQVGTGWGFAIVEVLDQIGAVGGPLIFTAVFLLLGAGAGSISGYQKGYLALAVPFVLLMLVVIYAYLTIRDPERFETAVAPRPLEDRLSRTFWLYTAFTFLAAFGLVSFVLIGYHLKARSLAPDAWIPLFYAAAMLIDAGMALVVGKLYDRQKAKRRSESGGLYILIVIPVLTAPIPFFAFSSSLPLILVAVVLFGAVMGAHETIMKAAIADITSLRKRGTGYGIFNTSYGLAMFFGTALAGALYEFSLPVLIAVVAAAEVLALAVFFLMARGIGAGAAGRRAPPSAPSRTAPPEP
jgi:MFS family permease